MQRFLLLLLLFGSCQLCLSNDYDDDDDDDTHGFLKNLFQNTPARYSTQFYLEFLPRFMELRNLKQKCSAESIKVIHSLLKEDVCQPRSVMVEIKTEDHTVVKVLPQHVLLKRCTGGTVDKHHGCIPTERKMVTIPTAKIISGHDGKFEQACEEIQLEEHISCAIGCKITPSDCNSHQLFVKEDCRCSCANQRDMQQCESAGKMWINAMCSCECLPSTQVDCSTGFVFDDRICRCVAISETAAVNDANVYNFYRRTFQQNQNKNS